MVSVIRWLFMTLKMSWNSSPWSQVKHDKKYEQHDHAASKLRLQFTNCVCVKKLFRREKSFHRQKYENIFVYEDCVTYTCFRYRKRKSTSQTGWRDAREINCFCVMIPGSEDREKVKKTNGLIIRELLIADHTVLSNLQHLPVNDSGNTELDLSPIVNNTTWLQVILPCARLIPSCLISTSFLALCRLQSLFAYSVSQPLGKTSSKLHAPELAWLRPERLRRRLLFDKLKIDRSVRDFISFEIVTFLRCF